MRSKNKEFNIIKRILAVFPIEDDFKTGFLLARQNKFTVGAKRAAN
jgi:hypothetical protein